MDSANEGQEFLLELNDHGTVVNALKFSPCGKFLASVSDRQIVVYSGNFRFSQYLDDLVAHSA